MDFWQHLAQTIYTEAGLVAMLLFITNLGLIALYRQVRGDCIEAHNKLERQSDRTLDVMDKYLVMLTRIEERLK